MALKLSEIPKANTLENSDIFLISRDDGNSLESKTTTLLEIRQELANNNFLEVSTGKINITGFVEVTDNETITDVAFSKGDIFFDASYMYVCVTNDYIKRVPLQDF